MPAACVATTPSTWHLAKYGTAGGFGWKVNEIIGPQIIQMPDPLARTRADAAFGVFMGSLIGVLLAIMLTLNLLLWWMCVRPIAQLSALADRISLGETDAPDFAVTGRDEIGRLAQALSRMRRSLVQRCRCWRPDPAGLPLSGRRQPARCASRALDAGAEVLRRRPDEIIRVLPKKKPRADAPRVS